ncbi:hypothetical protein M6B38_100775 [Iris pallida]|uniref:Uncharacterized protein n=1 Tax=Iris pallida TaxID=29817 RepID=A0AAX6IP87_IRIPA|nr:hypothetical protein M6B38_144155 [Iris pallida]KAJ6819093.1 hypothetical protein M6B38_403695 [Iris pallida]KAJ6835279.1 hypothetical protein M6B38_122900 [Iris pallida]KAJ6854047.1 hypothetical protein M6B38_100775 [Iris pallida]
MKLCPSHCLSASSSKNLLENPNPLSSQPWRWRSFSVGTRQRRGPFHRAARIGDDSSVNPSPRQQFLHRAVRFDDKLANWF